MDSSYPKDRISYMIDDAQLSVLITQNSLSSLASLYIGNTVFIDNDWKDIEKESTSNLVNINTSKNLAYIIYTSGSTGKPKGVMISHRNVINFFVGMEQRIGKYLDGVWLAVTSISFDISVLELFWTLSRGFKVVIQSDSRGVVSSTLSEADYSITEQIKRHKVSHLQCTPSLARVLTTEEEAKEAIKELKMMMVGGEALTTSLAKELINVIKGELHNMYGPTETTIWSSTHKVEANDRVLNTVTIGKPIANTQIYIVNEALELVPVGVAGELLIAGEGVVRGYFQRPELTSEKFIANPFSKSQTGKLYRTGDLARWLDDGTIEFLGRLDHQVKIRGFRIELGEIETLLLQHPEVSQAVVIAREDKRDEKKLVAYLVTKNSDETLPSTSEIQTYIRQQLPEYMVPSAVVYLQSIPL
ncbi:MAG: amino acid adenylation domain-containing protein [Blastocatellia bacterium]|nr:amino acid adenylation domain-containing protein [Blastocatellia bacterium]